MIKNWINSIELGQFRLGLQYFENKEWQVTWFQDDTVKILPPPQYKNLLKDKPKNAEFVLESKESYEGSLYLYFGDLLKDFDSELTIELGIDKTHGSVFRWKSNESNSEEKESYKKNLKNFYATYWGSANVNISLYNNKFEYFFESNSVPFIRRLEIGFNAWKEDVYISILNSLNRLSDKSDLASPLYKLGSLTNLKEDLLSLAEGSKILAAFFRVEALLKEYKKTLLLLLSKPASKIKPTNKFVNLEKQDDIENFYRLNKIKGYNSIDRIVIIKGKNVPVRFIAQTIIESYDIVENRFIVKSIKEVFDTIKNILHSLDSYLSERNIQLTMMEKLNMPDKPSHHYTNLKNHIGKHNIIKNQLVTYKNQMKVILSTFKVRFNIRDSNETGVMSELTNYNANYARLAALNRSLRLSLKTEHFNQNEIPFQITAFNDLYQYWTLKTVLKSLTDPIIGFEIETMGEVDLFYNKPIEDNIHCILKHTRFPNLRIELWYEKIYSKFSNKEDDNASYGIYDNHETFEFLKSNRPDISLEFWHPNFNEGHHPLIITLDPTISKGSTLKKKHGYLDSIRCFDPSYYDNKGRPLRLVKSAWAVYPGIDINTISANPKGDESYPITEYSKGNLALHPKNIDELPNNLKLIIESTVFQTLNLSFNM